MSKRYDIRDQIGKGGLGAVYKAFDTQLQREVAIKRVLSPDQATEEEVEEAARKLMAEAQTLSSLNHPNIVTVFDIGQDEQGGFVVMELLKGETLDETVQRGVLTQEDFTEVVYQTMEALIAAQANDVIHRDIKPTNIMVIWQASGKFQTKILDFGLAKFSKAPSVQTMDQDDSVMGSIYFMSPEQFERGELDARTDLYQMGCVYYNALTGQYPFNGETAPQVMNAHLQHRVIPLEQIRPDLSPSICQWVMWLINRDIEHRPKDARSALEQWPRHPQPPGAEPLKVLPVEETPDVESSKVKIVTGVSQAYAPPSLIIPSTGSVPGTGGRTGRLAGGRTGQLAGGRTGRLAGGRGRTTGPLTGRIGPGRTRSGVAAKRIVLGAIGAAVLLVVGVQWSKKSAERTRADRIAALAAAESPAGTAADVETAVALLENPRTPQALRTDAEKVLERLGGPGVEERIVASLQQSASPLLRVRLAQILSERGHEPAVPAILSAFRSAASDEQRVGLLNAARGVAGPGHVAELLEALDEDHSLAVRRHFEDTVLTVLRKSSDFEGVLDRIITQVSTATSSERRSLFRILGVLDGEKVKTRLASIYDREGDLEIQRDAMNAFLSWRDRSVLEEVERIAATTPDRALQSAAARAYARLASLPGPEPFEERAVIWRRALELSTGPSDVRRLMTSLLENPSPESLEILREWADDATHGAVARGNAASVERLMAGAPVLRPGDEIKGNRARVHGDSRAAINSSLESLTGWTSPDTWFSWVLKVAETGRYRIEVDQASEQEDASEFLVHLAGSTFRGESKRTGSLEDFETVALEGAVSLEEGEVYVLTLAAGDRVQPRMMDVGAVRLVAAE